MPLFTGDPLHLESRPDTVWVTGNVTEAIPGRPTPLTWTFFSSMIRSSLAGALVDIGALSRSATRAAIDGGDPPIGIFHGHPAGNIELFLRAAAASPGNSAAATERQMFGATLSAHRYPDHRKRYAAMALRMPIAFGTVARRLRRHRTESITFWRRSLAERPDLDRARALVRESADRFEAVGRPHLLQLMLAQGLYEQVVRLAERAGCPGVENRLLTGSRELEETGLVESLAAVAAGDRPMPRFLEEYGYHAPNEGEIASRSWREDPDQLTVILRGYSATSVPVDRSGERTAAEAELLRGLPAVRRPAARLLLRLARDHMPMRNVGKNAYLRLIDVARFAARVIGAKLVAAGTLEAADDVFWLTLDEITHPRPPDDLRPLIAERRARHDDHAKLALKALAWEGRPELVPLNPAGPADGPPTVVTGTPVYPGVVDGRVRIVANPSEIDEPLTATDVVVARTTDPGWASIMMTAGAFVIDIGNPMSHAAVVARELGVPCVIGTENGTTALRDGQRVRVDGGAGTVTPLSPSGDEETL